MIGAGAVIVAGLFYGLERTRIGAQIRAAVDNRRMAESCGINTGRLFTLTFALGSGMAAIGGGLGIQILGGLKPVFAFEYLVIFLIVVAVGGLGNIRGTFFAALLLGIIDFAGKYFLPEGGSFFIYLIDLHRHITVAPAGSVRPDRCDGHPQCRSRHNTSLAYRPPPMSIVLRA